MNFLLSSRKLMVLPILLINFIAFAQEASFVRLEKETVVSLNSDKNDYFILTIIIKENFHIQANQVNDENLVPTKLSFDETDGIQFGQPIFPKTEDLPIKGLDNPWKVYSERLEIKVPVQFDITKGNRDFIIKGNLFYQACDDKKCFFPRDFNFKINLIIK
jgi:hypothetical protein